jgi:hypothetical protein
MARVTKTSQVKSHLMTKGSITSWEAIENYRATRLSAIIFKLRDKGMNIVTEDLEAVDRNGNAVKFAKYVLKK